MRKHFYLSHQILVLNLSGPCLDIASFKFVVFTDNSEVGYVSLLINVPFGTSGLFGCPYGFGVKAGNPLLLKLANASGPFRNEEIQYCVFICCNSVPAPKGFAAI